MELLIALSLISSPALSGQQSAGRVRNVGSMALRSLMKALLLGAVLAVPSVRRGTSTGGAKSSWLYRQVFPPRSNFLVGQVDSPHM